jgi:anti-sigma factor RsiW
MTHAPHARLSCDDAAALVPDFLDGGQLVTEREALERHLAACAACTALVADLGAIRREAAALPTLSPSRDLWAGIAARIEAPVMPLAAAPTARRPAPRWRAIAAGLVLVAGTAGVTYTVTARQNGQRELTASPPRVTAPARGVGHLASAPATSLEGTYGQEIATMQRILDQRRTSLDSGTVAVLERNLTIIDQAIRESRAALARDPASRFLTEQLTEALDQKLELMRTAVLLTSRT